MQCPGLLQKKQMMAADSKFVLMTSLLPQDCINGMQVGSLFFVNLTNACTVSFISPVYAGDMATLLWLSLLVVKNALNFICCFD
jgi:hypothetical protein